MATVNEKMTALADEIRILSGTEGTMGLDAMKNNVNAANSAVSAAITALTEKGVEVPDGTNVTGLAELISAIESGGSTLWNGGKFTIGSFVLAEETAGSYTIATGSDDAMLGLLNDGESLSTQSVYTSIGLMVVRRPTSVNISGSELSGYLGFTIRFPTYFGNGGSSVRYMQYWDNYGSPKGTSGGAYVSANELSVYFTSSAKGSPNFEYLWLAWRGVN